jgi:predicted dinucleotide-binding enzyme
VFIAGDDDGTKETVVQLARDGGLRAVDVGLSERARHLESLRFLQMMVQQPLSLGFQSTLKVVS